MVNETALAAIKMGSIIPIHGELARVAEDIPKSEAIGLAHTPTHAPLLQQAKRMGAAEVKLPVMDVQIVFFAAMVVLLLF